MDRATSLKWLSLSCSSFLVLISSIFFSLPVDAQQVVANGTTQTASGTVNTGTANNASGYGLYALNSGVINSLSALSVITGGAGAYGAYALSAGKINVFSGSSIQTSGNGAYGMYSQGVGSTVGASSTSISTVGPSSHGAEATQGGVINLNGGAVSTIGNQSHGLFAFLSNSTITATNVSVTTNGSSSNGANANVAAHITLNGGSVTTGGSQADALLTIDGGATLDATGTTVRTTGPSAVGAHALVGSMTLTSVGITTTGLGAYGGWVDNASRLSLSGGAVSTASSSSTGLLASSGSTLTINNVAVSTSGPSSIGVSAQFGSNVNIQGGSVTTTGSNSTGLFSVGLLSTTVTATPTPSSVIDVASGLPGAVAGTIGASLSAAGVTVTTSGANANGAVIRGASSLTLSGSRISTMGTGAVALFASAYDSGPSTATIGNSVLESQQGSGIRASATTFNVGLTGSTVSGNPAVLDSAGGNLSVLADTTTLNGSAVVTAGGTSNLTLQNQSTWNLSGDSTLSSLSNNMSLIAFTTPVAGTFKTLTVGSYAGQQGVLGLNSYLGTDSSASDRLVIDSGSATGTSRLRIANAGGPGGLTTANGIPVVETINGGQTDSAAFALDGRAVAGAYEYRLFRGTSTDPADENWYLRSDQTPTPPAPPGPPSPTPPAPPEPPKPLYRPEVAAYLANQHLAGQMFVQSLHDRLGEPQYLESQGFDPQQSRPSSTWVRMVGNWEGSHSQDGTFQVDSDTFLLQAGAEVAKWKVASDADRAHVGLMATYDYSHSNVEAAGNPARAHGIVEGYGVGIYGTWYQDDREKLGAYVDTWFQYGWFNNKVEGDELPTVNYNAQGWAVSGEMGYAMPLPHDWVVEPQGQLIYVDYNESDIDEPNGTRVAGADSSGWISRLGVRFYRLFTRQDGRKVQPYATVNWWHTTTNSSITFNELPVGSLYPSNRYELKIGANLDFGRRWTGWANVSGAWGEQSYHQYVARGGVKYAW